MRYEIEKKEDALRKIADEIYRRTGIKIDEKKLTTLERRVIKRMEELYITEIGEYLELIENSDDEFQELINLITVNETYFFRERYQLDAFEEILREIVREYGQTAEVKIWSAGCSTGEEPYTIAMIISENFPLMKPRIVATDIDTSALKIARMGVYDARKLRHVPPKYMKYFRKKEMMYEVIPTIKAKVRFMQLNLFDKNIPSFMNGFDFIFCRNVLIYFDDKSRREVANMFYKVLKPGGYVFLGHSESMSRISSAFLPVRKKDVIVYMKPK